MRDFEKEALPDSRREFIFRWWRMALMTGTRAQPITPTLVDANVSEGDPRLPACAALHPLITDKGHA